MTKLTEKMNLGSYTISTIQEFTSSYNLKKFLDKVKHIEPLIVENISFVAGGCIRSLLDDSTEEFSPRDIDVYFYDQSGFDKFSNVMHSSFNYKFLRGTVNAITYKNIITNIDIDLILKRFDIPSRIMDDFDFNVCKFTLYKKDGDLYLMRHYMAMHQLENKLMDISNSEIQNPDLMFNRMCKYSSYGFTPTTVLKERLFNGIKKNYMIDSGVTAVGTTHY